MLEPLSFLQADPYHSFTELTFVANPVKVSTADSEAAETEAKDARSPGSSGSWKKPAEGDGVLCWEDLHWADPSSLEVPFAASWNKFRPPGYSRC